MGRYHASHGGLGPERGEWVGIEGDAWSITGIVQRLLNKGFTIVHASQGGVYKVPSEAWVREKVEKWEPNEDGSGFHLETEWAWSCDVTGAEKSTDPHLWRPARPGVK